MFTYIRPLFRMRLLQIRKNILPCSVSTPRHSLRKVSRLSGGMPFLIWTHLQHLARATSASWACSQSTMCISSNFAAWTLAFWFRCSFSSKSPSLALASPLSAAPTIAPSSRDRTVCQLWLMRTWLRASAAPLSVLFWYSSSN